MSDTKEETRERGLGGKAKTSTTEKRDLHEALRYTGTGISAESGMAAETNQNDD